MANPVVESYTEDSDTVYDPDFGPVVSSPNGVQYRLSVTETGLVVATPLS